MKGCLLLGHVFVGQILEVRRWRSSRSSKTSLVSIGCDCEGDTTRRSLIQASEEQNTVRECDICCPRSSNQCAPWMAESSIECRRCRPTARSLIERSSFFLIFKR